MLYDTTRKKRHSPLLHPWLKGHFMKARNKHKDNWLTQSPSHINQLFLKSKGPTDEYIYMGQHLCLPKSQEEEDEEAAAENDGKFLENEVLANVFASPSSSSSVFPWPVSSTSLSPSLPTST